MGKAISTAFLLSVAILAASCRQEVPDTGTGYLYVSAGKDLSVEPVVKADADSPVALKVTDASGSEVLTSEDVSSLGTVQIRTGQYHAVATSGTDQPAAFDSPFYAASEDFTVKYGEVTNLSLVLTLDNVKVTASFSESISENFSSYVLTVSNGSGTLVFDKDAEGGSTLDREGYFAATGTLTWSLALTNAEGEVFEPIVQTYEDVRPRQHYALNFDVEQENEAGGLELSISVDGTMNEKEYDLVLDFVNKDVPKIQTDIDLSSESTYYTGDLSQKDFLITTPNQNDFTSLAIMHASDALIEAGLPEEIELVGATPELVESLGAAGISVQSVASGTYSSEIDMTAFISTLPAGNYELEFYAENTTGASKLWTYSFVIMSSVETASVNPWARFAVLEGKLLSPDRPEGLGFAYREQSASEWTYVTGSSVGYDEQTGTFSTEVALLPGTPYEFRAVTAYEEASVMQFSTELEQMIPNMSFDAWYNDGDVQYPNASADEFYWDTANGGSKALSVYPTTKESSVVVSGNAAKLESKEVALVGIAAGNIYTGRFIKAIVSLTNPGAELDWGVPFTSRPLALRGWYHYLPKTVNQGSHAGMSGKTDIGQIQIMLTDWTAPFRINTQSKTFVDVANDPHIIGYGTLDLNETSGYTEFEIKVDYRDTSRKPAYIVIVGAASKYGDYFTGGIGSILYLDEFSLVYDPSELK